MEISAPQVDIVVLNYNGKKFLDDCFQSIRLSVYKNIRIYLLDNASTDDSIAYTLSNYPEVEIIRNPENNGFCAAYNLAFSICEGKYIVCLNNDVKVKPDWLNHLVEAAEKDENIAALQPKIVSFFDEHSFEYAGASGGMIDIYGYPFLRGRIFNTIEHDLGQYNDVQEIFWTSGAAMFIRKSALVKSGILDDTIVHHMDEIDLCWRMRMQGYSLQVIPKSVIAHYGGATITAQSFKKMYWNHRNAIFIMLKNYGSEHVFGKTAIHILLDIVAVFYSLFVFEGKRSFAISAAYCWVLLNIPLIIRKRKEVQSKRKVNDKVIMKYMYPKSVVLAYFLGGRKTYMQLINPLSTISYEMSQEQILHHIK